MAEGTLRKAFAAGTASRYRQNVATVFDCLVEVAAPSSGQPSWPLWKYPEDFEDVGKLKAVCEFAYPAGPVVGEGSEAVQMFTFVLTGTASDYTFGYCRHTPKSKTCLVLLSGLPWTNFFYKLLNHFATVMNNGTSEELEALLVRGYHQEIPGPGYSFVVESSLGKNKVECVAPDDSKLPTLQDNKYLQDYYGCVADHSKNINMIAVFVSLLQERRVIITGQKVGQVSHCVLAAERLIYPLFWQYPFIPVLTKYEFLHCPTPFLAGVPSSIFQRAKQEVDFSELVVLDIDEKTFTSPFNDLANFPHDIMRNLKYRMRKLKHNLRHTNHLLGDGLARSFLRALAELLGGYRAGLHRPIETGQLSFDYDRFLAAYEKRNSMKNYLTAIRGSQVVQQFFDERVGRLNSGAAMEDVFEEERRNLMDLFPSSTRDAARDYKEGASYRPTPPKGPSLPRMEGRMDAMASMVQDKLQRIPSLTAHGSHKFVDLSETSESPTSPNGLESGEGTDDDRTPSTPSEGNLLNFDDPRPIPSSTSVGSLDPIHASRSMSDLLALATPPEPVAPKAKALSPPAHRPLAAAPSLHGSASQGANLNRMAEAAAARNAPAVPSPLAKSGTSGGLSGHQPVSATKGKSDLIDWSYNDPDPILEFDPLASGERLTPLVLNPSQNSSMSSLGMLFNSSPRHSTTASPLSHSPGLGLPAMGHSGSSMGANLTTLGMPRGQKPMAANPSLPNLASQRASNLIREMVTRMPFLLLPFSASALLPTTPSLESDQNQPSTSDPGTVEPVPRDEKSTPFDGVGRGRSRGVSERRPEEWSSDDIMAWLFSVARKHAIPPEDMALLAFATLPQGQFHALTLTEFHRLDADFGPLLFSELQEEKKKRAPPVLPSPTEVRTESAVGKGGKKNVLWKFFIQLLSDAQSNPSVVKWLDRERGIFAIVDSGKLASLWDTRKNRTKPMNYEKLSRALRAYYKHGVLLPGPRDGIFAKKLVYQFGPNSAGLWRPAAALYLH